MEHPIGVWFFYSSTNLICDVTNVILEDIGLCRIVGIVSDNAVEEAELLRDKRVSLPLERRDENAVALVVSNTTKGDVDTKHIFPGGYSNQMGIGLPQTLQILNTYEHCSLLVNDHDNPICYFS